MKPPIFIFGVPRSGTTLLRTILNCHPHIACGPEAPWLANHLPQSVMAMQEMLVHGQHSYCEGFQVPAAMATSRIRELVDGLFSDFARQQGKIRWAHKTPDDSMYVGFFTALFPDAKFIHLVRHPLDAALSTTTTAAHRVGISDWHEKNILLQAGFPVKRTRFNSVLRWRRWNDVIRASLATVDHVEVQYEELVGHPKDSFQALFAYLDEPFSPEILDYKKFPGILPDWEWGSADVKNAKSINTASVGRWKKELTAEEAAVLSSLAGADESSPALVPGAAFARPAEDESNSHNFFLTGLNDLAASFGLSAIDAGPMGWAQGWLWFAGLKNLDWPRVRLVHFGAGLSITPWFFALLGAKVTLIESSPAAVPHWEELKLRLKLELDWHILPDSAVTLPLESSSTDVVFNPQPGTWQNANEVIRILKPTGLLALIFAAADGVPMKKIRSHPAWTPISGPLEAPADQGASSGFGAALLKKQVV